MKTLLPLLWAAGCVVLAASLAQAQYPAYTPVTCQPVPPAPDACGPGYYFYDCYGTQFGPTHNVYPCFQPYQGALPQFRPAIVNGKPYLPSPQAGPPNFATHPYARSPRDFFMWAEAQRDRATREQLPRFVP
jgi:hypothetical protein